MLHIVKISSRWQKTFFSPWLRLCVEDLFFRRKTISTVYSKPREWQLNNFRLFRALIIESQCHFKKRERVKGFIEVSMYHQRTEICRAWRIIKDRTTRHALNFAVNEDKPDLSSWTCCSLPFYVVKPGPRFFSLFINTAVYCLLSQIPDLSLSIISAETAVDLFWESYNYVCLETFPCFLHQFDPVQSKK